MFQINKVPIKWINAIWPLMQVYLCVFFWFHLRTHNLGVVRQQYSSSSLERTQSSSHTSIHLTFLIFFKDWLQVNTLLSYSNHQRKEMVSTLHSNKPAGQHSPVQPFVKKPLILHPQGIFSKNQRLNHMFWLFLGAPSETSPPKSIGIISPNTSTSLF